MKKTRNYQLYQFLLRAGKAGKTTEQIADYLDVDKRAAQHAITCVLRSKAIRRHGKEGGLPSSWVVVVGATPPAQYRTAPNRRITHNKGRHTPNADANAVLNAFIGVAAINTKQMQCGARKVILSHASDWD